MRLVFASLLSPSAFGAFLFGKRVSSFGLPVAAGRLGRNTRPALSVQMSTESAAPGSLPSKTLVVANPSAADLNYTTWKAQAKALVESIYDGISAPFSCSGTLTVQHPVQVTTLKDEVTYTIQPPPAVPEGEGQPSEADAAKEMVERQVDLLKAFVEQAPPAVFGKGSEELYDEKVRHGRQLAADAFSTNIDAEALRGVLRQVQKDLGLRVGIEAEPYSVNIYEEGGLFESHKDTPRGRGMFGTLVMCLPSLFVGGALQVGMTHATVQSYFGLHFDQCKDPFKESLSGDPSWWSPDRAASGGYKIPWCAFFSDADHCVRPVRKGVRVSLSYLLRRSDDGDSDAGLAPRRAIEKDDDQASELMKAFRLIKFNPFKCQVSVGFPCDHLYTTSDVFPDRGRPRDPDDIRREGHMYESGSIKSMNKLTADAIGKLKGRDLLVASAAHSVGLQVFLMPFLTSRDGDHYITSFDAWYLDEVDGEQYQVLDQVFDPPPDCSRPGDVADVWIKGHLDGGRRHEAQVGYLGNGPAEFYEYYMHAALVVEPPPRRVLRFSLGDGLVDDIFVDRDPAPDETMRQVIDRAVQYDSGHRLFRDPAIAPALEGSDGGGSEASASASVELAGGVADQPTSIETMSLQDFLGMTTEALLGRFSPDTNPIGIRVVVIQKEKSDDREVPETRSSKMPKLS